MRSEKHAKRLALFVVGLLVCISPAVYGTHPCTSPLILDLDDDGILTTGLIDSVHFDINGDGEENEIGWTFWETEEAFLWLDGNHNHVVDDGGELFGSSTLLPTAEYATNGFEALAIYDQVDFGGNEDGVISRADLIWRLLRLWIDSNHDGVSQRSEIRTLRARGVVLIDLAYSEIDELDGHLNRHAFRGTFVKKVSVLGGVFHRRQTIEDIFFVVAEEETE